MKYLIYIFLTGTLFFTASCEIDEIKPINRLTEDNVIRDEASARTVLNRVYNSFRSQLITDLYGSMAMYGIEQDPFFGIVPGFPNNDVTSDNFFIEGIYAHYYFIINNANFLITALERGDAEGISDVNKNEILAQARTLRALAHFDLLRVFGEFYDLNSEYGIVVSTTPINGNEGLPRSTVSEAYDVIVEDLQFAILNGPTNLPHFYINSTTAKALLSKVYLYMENYQEASILAEEVIATSGDGFSLAQNYDEIYFEKYGVETLFAPYVDGLNELTAFTGFDLGFGATPSLYFRNIADSSDGIDGDGDFMSNSSGYDNRFLYAYSPATAGPNLIGKYPHEEINSPQGGGNTIFYLRMAEVYLISAEAEIRKTNGDSEFALERLNEIRERAGMPLKEFTDVDTFLKDLRDEKMLELFIENGETWFDLVRYHILGNINISDLKPTITSDDKLILPMPAAALAGNSSLVPNPGQ